MPNVVHLDAYRERRASTQQRTEPTDSEDTILLRKKSDGTYRAHINGEYSDDDLLSIEHLTDLAKQIARSRRFRGA